MEYNEIITNLFLESFWSAVFSPFKDEFFLKNILEFSSLTAALIFMVALIASIFGSIFNFFIGRFFIILEQKIPLLKLPESRLSFIKDQFQQKFYWVILLCWVDLIGSIIVLASGFLGLKFRNFLLLMIPAKLVYYYILVYLY